MNSLPIVRTDAAGAAALLTALIEIPSVNPAYDPASPGENQLGDAIAEYGRRLGLSVALADVINGRRNVEIRLPAPTPSRRLMMEVHSDTVGLPPGVHRPRAEVRGNVMHGRGACDVKGGLAAALIAVARLAESGELHSTEVVLLAAVDEEHEFRGIAKHLASQTPPDAAIVIEPTELRLVNAHNGVVRVEVLVEGTAAHTSRPEQGRNAIIHAVELVCRLEAWHQRENARDGREAPSSLSITTIAGGSAINVVPAECRLGLDIRTCPTEDAGEILGSLRYFLAEQTSVGIFAAIERVMLVDGGMYTPDNDAFVMAARQALDDNGLPSEPVWVPYGTDGSKLARAGVPTVVFGPGSIDQAHADDEWIEIDQVVAAARTLQSIVEAYDNRSIG